jgi:Kef-type K+ transport system membrane component KefB
VVLSLTAAGARAPGTMLLAVLAYLAAMLLLVRPLLARVLAAMPEQAGGSDRIVLAVSVVFLSAITTDAIGLHAMLGTFVAGAVLPRDALKGWREPLVHFSHVMLLPFFFILTGMRLRIDVNDPGFLQLTAVLTLTAVLCKLFSVAAAARCCGMRWRQSFALGSLMQCKGLMELVAINILLDAGVIGVQVFSALAMMALLSTFFTAPALRLVWRNGASGAAAEVRTLKLVERT